MDSSLPDILDFEHCQQFGIAPILADGIIDHILISSQTDINILSAVKFSLGRHISHKMVDQDTISHELELLKSNTQSNHSSTAQRHENNVDIMAPVIELVDSIISEAIKLSASDIHFEPFDNIMTVRYRLDGVLQQKQEIKKSITPAVISRIKIMSGLDIAEKRRPQDGRIRFTYNSRIIDIRVSVLPTDFGEKIVLRLLDKAALKLDLNALGFSTDDLGLFKEKIKLPNGIILITGPTGSGKTTTLYAALNHIKSPGINITSIEDPIEYNLEGINQTQIKPNIGLTFAHALRAILRQDPNVIMVGEIRDSETLDNALRASMTGHLVLSTVHTNDSVSAIARLIDLGAESYLLESSLKLIVAQRLVRKICPFCAVENDSRDERSAALALGLPENLPIRHGKGCDNCHSIGYWGRTAIYEILAVDEEIANMLRHSVDRKKLVTHLRENGMITLREHGLQLIKEGITTPSEVLRETC